MNRLKLSTAIDGYDTLFADVVRVLEGARRAAARSVSTVMTATYWLVGRRIVKFDMAVPDPVVTPPHAARAPAHAACPASSR